MFLYSDPRLKVDLSKYKACSSHHQEEARDTASHNPLQRRAGPQTGKLQYSSSSPVRGPAQPEPGLAALPEESGSAAATQQDREQSHKSSFECTAF
eukprot:204193-Pelagomonas_calceolata.AAC.9